MVYFCRQWFLLEVVIRLNILTLMADRRELIEFLHQSLLSGSTGRLDIESSETTGSLYLKYGHLVHAVCHSFVGEEALWALLREDSTSIEFASGELPEQETITRPTELILMESAVHIDQPENALTPAPSNQAGAVKADPKPFFRITTSVKFAQDDENARKIYILSPGTTTLGRSPGCDLVIGDKTISRQHAEITVRGNKVTLKDLGGRNGTRVNSRQVQIAELRNNDTLMLGMTTLRFYWSQKGEPILVQEPSKISSQSPTGPIKLPPPR